MQAHAMRWVRGVLAALMAAGLTMPANASAPSAAFEARAEQLVELFTGDADHAEMFSAAVLAQVPPAQFDAIGAQMTGQYGAPTGIERIVAASAHAGTVHIGFEKAVAELDMAIEGAPPHRITGLLIKNVAMRNDSAAALIEEIAALPGTTGFAIARLGEGSPQWLHRRGADRPLAIGSAFKLFILAELVRQIDEGRLAWADVVEVGDRSLPSGILQDWPDGSPVTIHTLAALMISRSDNTATDLLLRKVGRDNVEALLPALGLADPARNRPFLSTYEMFALKGVADETRAEAFAAADEAGRRTMLSEIAAVPRDRIEAARFSGGPLWIDSIEWFASAEDLVRTLDWLRLHGGETAHAILAINPGIGSSAAGRFDYLGYKGGSEPGVINLSFLVKAKDGAWYAVTGSWNDAAEPVENDRFVQLMSRAVQLLD